MTRRDLGFVVMLALVVAGMILALSRIRFDDELGVPDLPPFAWGVLLGLAVGLRAKGRLGEYRQAARHTFLGVGRGHLDLLHGRRP